MAGVEGVSGTEFMQAVLSKSIQSQGQAMMRLLEVVRQAEMSSAQPLRSISESTVDVTA
jgi:hypothetical protein